MSRVSPRRAPKINEPSTGPTIGRQGDRPSVDVELILAVDVSYSMDMDELAIQREGTPRRSFQGIPAGAEDRPERQDFGDLFRVGGLQRPEDHHSVAGDRRPETADAVANEIEDADPPGVAHLDLGRDQFRDAAVRRNPHRGLRRVIDISGDGPNNNGSPVTIARDAALEKGITINGLPIW
jgi:hypothetical protein